MFGRICQFELKEQNVPYEVYTKSISGLNNLNSHNSLCCCYHYKHNNYPDLKRIIDFHLHPLQASHDAGCQELGSSLNAILAVSVLLISKCCFPFFISSISCLNNISRNTDILINSINVMFCAVNWKFT